MLKLTPANKLIFYANIKFKKSKKKIVAYKICKHILYVYIYRVYLAGSSVFTAAISFTIFNCLARRCRGLSLAWLTSEATEYSRSE